MGWDGEGCGGVGVGWGGVGVGLGWGGIRWGGRGEDGVGHPNDRRDAAAQAEPHVPSRAVRLRAEQDGTCARGCHACAVIYPHPPGGAGCRVQGAVASPHPPGGAGCVRGMCVVYEWSRARLCACVCACMRARMRVCVHACAHACVRACVRIGGGGSDDGGEGGGWRGKGVVGAHAS